MVGSWTWSGVVHGSGTLRTVALSGKPVPGLSAGVTFQSFQNATINASQGWTAFPATLQGAGVSDGDDTAIFSEVGGAGLRVVAREGAAPIAAQPNLAYADVGYTRAYAVNAATVFSTFVLDEALASRSIVGRNLADGSFQLIALQNEPAPKGPSNRNVGYVLALSGINSLGHASFLAMVTGDGVSPYAIGPWIEDAAKVAIPIYNDGVTPLGAGITVQGIGSADINDFSEGFISARLAGSGITAVNENSLWRYDANGLSLFARGGDPAPGLPGRVFKNFSATYINNAGKSLIQAGMDNNRGAIWSDRNGSGLELIMRDGQQVPGALPGVVFGYLPSGGTGSVSFNDAGQVAFIGALEGTGVTETNQVGVYSDVGGNGLQKITRTGDLAPGTGPSIVFAGLQTFWGLAFNERGQTAFYSRLAGPGVDSSNNAGIWAQDVNQNLKLIVRLGDMLDVSDDASNPDLRMVSYVDLFGDRKWSLNDRGQIAFHARFTDGSEGIFVSNAVAIPEPAAAVLLALAVAPMLARRGAFFRR
ncbi:DUF7453 family protein [Lacipirellula sp.]|uniref:DUF7453 family protein n=1 Tax=Lacipirellula sp. TaxID=2691419 RepID=UPI003D0EFC39